MSQQSKREVVELVRHRYLQGKRKEKTKILDEFVATTSLHRKAAIRALRRGYQRGQDSRGQPRVYTGAAVAALSPCGGYVVGSAASAWRRFCRK